MSKVTPLPDHIAIIMDGSGRWAKKRFLPRVAGHKQGVQVFRNIVEVLSKKGIATLTVFAFSSENWQRPAAEVKFLMELLLSTIRKEVQNIHKNNIKLTILGERDKLSAEINSAINQAEALTEHNTGLHLNIALNYGGHWDITQAALRLAKNIQTGIVLPESVSSVTFERYLALGDTKAPDLFIRTGGERRLSNFLLWHLAYTELHFTDKLWPDFTDEDLELALQQFAQCERRFGKISEQLVTEDA